MNSQLWNSTGILIAICGVLAASCGCGSKPQQIKDRASISGLVTIDGKPLPAGTIGLESETSKTSTSIPIREGGKYSSDRAPMGKVLVTVDTSSIHFGNPAAYVPIPAKYNNSKTSGLSADVQSGDNEGINFELKSM